MKKIMLIVLAAAALLLCGCGNEVQSDFNDEYIEIDLPPNKKFLSIHKPSGEPFMILTRPFKDGEKAEEYYLIAVNPLAHNYKIKGQE